MPHTRSSQTRTLQMWEERSTQHACKAVESALRQGTGACQPSPEDAHMLTPSGNSGPDRGGLASMAHLPQMEPHMPITTTNMRVRSPTGSADPSGSANPLGHRPCHGPELGPSKANAEQGADRPPASNTGPGAPLPRSEVSEIHQMLKELCDGQSQIQQWHNVVEDRSLWLQTHGTSTELE